MLSNFQNHVNILLTSTSLFLFSLTANLACEPSDPEGTGSGGGSESTGTESETGSDSLVLEGNYTDDFATTHQITSESWTMSSEGLTPSIFNIAWYDNEMQLIVAQNDKSNEYNPEKWSAFQWTYTSDQTLWYCQIVFDAPTQEEAESASPADASDPAQGGCGMFSWTKLVPSAN